MNKPLSVTETVQLIQEINAASARLEEHGSKLSKESAQRSAILRRQLEAESDQVKRDSASAREQLKREFDAKSETFVRRKEKREHKISDAEDSIRKRALAAIEETENRTKFAVQKGILEAERIRDKGLLQTEKDYETYERTVEEKREDLLQLKTSAHNAFRGFPRFRRQLRDHKASSEEPPSPDHKKLFADVLTLEQTAASDIRRFRMRGVTEMFRLVPLWVWFILFASLALAGPERIGLGNIDISKFRLAVGGLFAFWILLYFLTQHFSRSLATKISTTLARAEHLLDLAVPAAAKNFHHQADQIRLDSENRFHELQRDWDKAENSAEEARENAEKILKKRIQHALERNQRLATNQVAMLEERLKTTEIEARNQFDQSVATLNARTEAALSSFQAEAQAKQSELSHDWTALLDQTRIQLSRAQAFKDAHFPPWTESSPYRPIEVPLNAASFGSFSLTVPNPLAPTPSGTSIELAAPLTLVFPQQGSIVLESDDSSREAAVNSLNNLVYRILQSVPPGKASFTLIDPVRLGESFSGLMHLADLEESMVNRRIWTSTAEIEERLLELNSHMEKVIQMYLRNEFADIVEYNKQAGRIAEKYHFLVLADFPANFSETALRRLIKIAASGARCGVFTLIHWDARHPLPPGFEMNDILVGSAHIRITKKSPTIPAIQAGNLSVQLEKAPEPELATQFLQAVGEASRGSNTVQVPFAQIEPPPAQRWSLETTEELRVPIGRTGATKLQYMALGKGTRQHVLIAGKTGSGKSTLFHVLVTNLALWCSPDQVEFYLVDFKKGVEFKDYAVHRLPHARVIAIESDREFGLSVLRRVDEELRSRGELFRTVGAQDLPGYKRASSGAKMPRVLLIIDEFQELFVEDDSISQAAALLLDRIVRQGRAFGIHVVLGSQTLGGAYSLARSTLGQMVVRIALQCNEADAYLIMDETNPAPRLLSRPGEGIYNDSGGMVEANSPFQVVWLPEQERREALQEVLALAEKNAITADPIVFEGNTPADLAANTELTHALTKPAGGATVWLGLPNEIKGPTHVLLDARTGKNLLIAGQHDDHARALLAASMFSLAAQNTADTVRIILLEIPTAHPEAHLSLADVARELPHPVQIPKVGELATTLRDLVVELERRETEQSGPAIFLVIHNLSAFKALRPEDEFSFSSGNGTTNPTLDFQKIYTDGPAVGIHVIAHVDGFNNATRFLGRRGLKEFTLRVLFQMSASDSANFSDDSRASNLGLNRALLYDEQEGTFQTFRPYARPSQNWITQFTQSLRQNRTAAIPEIESIQ